MNETKKVPTTAEAFALLREDAAYLRREHPGTVGRMESMLALLERRMGAVRRVLQRTIARAESFAHAEACAADEETEDATADNCECFLQFLPEMRSAITDASPVFTEEEVEPIRHLGALMSNICFNLGQDTHPESSGLRPETRQQMRDLQRQWDAAVSALRRGGR
jgi:hypothetical protein